MRYKGVQFFGARVIAVWLLLIAPFANGFSFTTFDFAPFSYHDQQGKASGPLVELINLVCIEMNEECSFKLVPNRRAKKMAASGQTGGIFPLGWNEGRRDDYYFSVPLLVTEYGLYVPSKHKGKLNSLEGLQGYKVGVFGPSNTYTSLLELQNQMVEKGLKPMNIIVKTDANGQIIQMLAKERFDAYYTNRAVAEHRTHQFSVKGVEYAWHHKSVMYFIGFPRRTTDPEWVRRFNQTALKIIQTENTFQWILEQYGLESAPISEQLLITHGILH